MSKRKNEMEKFIKEILAMYNCNILYIVNGEKWYGNYGSVCYVRNNKIYYHYENLRAVYKTAHKIFMDTRIPQDDRIFAASSWDGSLVLFDNAHTSKYNSDLYVLSNGQIYDALNKYWFDIHASKKIKKLLKGGYNYTDPQTFYRDQYNDEE